jgi:hypothetical protein
MRGAVKTVGVIPCGRDYVELHDSRRRAILSFNCTRVFYSFLASVALTPTTTFSVSSSFPPADQSHFTVWAANGCNRFVLFIAILLFSRLSAARTASLAVGRSFRSFHLFPGRVIDKCFHFGAHFRSGTSSDRIRLKRSFVEHFKSYRTVCLFIV